MPCLTREERDAIDRDCYRQDLGRKIRGEMESATPEERKGLLAEAVAQLRVVLDAGEYHKCADLGERVQQTSGALGWVNWSEENQLHLAAIPGSLPTELPPGAPIFYGTHHGKRFDGGAKLVTRSHLVGYTIETCLEYEGTVDGRPAYVPASHIDWRRLNQ